MQLYDVLRHYRGRNTIICTDERAKALAFLKKRRDAEHVRGVLYILRPSLTTKKHHHEHKHRSH